MPNEKLTLTVGLDGKEETKRGLDEISDAQKKVSGDTDDASQPIENLNDEQKKLNASSSDYIGILTQINPVLGQLADGFLKSSNIAGDLASKNISLSGSFKKATEAIKGNAAALKLIGAAGLVVAAIFAITAALKAMREEAERVAKATREIIDAQTDLKQEAAANQQSIEAARDASGLTPFDETQARAAGNTFGRVRGKFDEGFLSDDAIKRTIAILGGASDFDGGGSRSINEISQIAFLQQAGKLDLSKVAGATGDTRIENALSRFSDTLEAAFGREAIQRGESVKQAVAESKAEGSVADLEELAKKFTVGTGSDPREVAAIAQALKPLRDDAIAAAGGNRVEADKAVALLVADALNFKGQFGGVSLADITNRDLQIANQMLDQLKAINERLDRAPRGAQTIVNDNRGAHFLGDTAAAQRARMVNGENKRDRSGL